MPLALPGASLRPGQLDGWLVRVRALPPWRWTREETAAHLRAVASLAFADWFEFEVAEPVEAATGAPGNGLRFQVRCLLDGRQFENFHLDVGYGDPVLGTPDVLTAPDVLAFADIAPAKVRCCPLTTQIAEKLHTYTRTYASGETSRARDLADILLAASLEQFNNTKLRQAIEATFRARASHAVPRKMPEPPERIRASYRKLVRELDLPWATIEEAARAAAQFLNPILMGNAHARWDPIAWRWR